MTHFVDHKVAGFLLEKEIKFLKGAVDSPKRPFAAIVGGAKVSTKIPVIESLIEKCDKIFIGGGMIFTFYRAMGLTVGNSMVEEEFIPVAKALIAKAAKKGVKFILPSDVVIADEFKAEANSKVRAKSIKRGIAAAITLQCQRRYICCCLIKSACFITLSSPLIHAIVLVKDLLQLPP